MKKYSIAVLTMIFLLSLSVTALAVAPQNSGGANSQSLKAPPYATDRILIQLTEDALLSPSFQHEGAAPGSITTGLGSLDTKITNLNARAMYKAYKAVKNKLLDKLLGVFRWYMLELPENSDIKAIIDQLKSDPNVANATPDYIAHAYPAVLPDDPMYSSQWGHDNTGQLLDYCWNCGGHPNGNPVGTVGFDGNVEAAWTVLGSYGSPSIIIAIIDSGVDIDHPDLNLVTGYDFGDNDSNPDDDSDEPGHGTACAGIAAAIANNGIGVAGVAGGCGIMPLKVANSAGTMYFSSIQDALYHAADNGADVVSMSLGAGISSDSATDTALHYAYNEGVTLLAATGNENAGTISYPAINQYVIAVGAANPCDGRKRSSSNSGELNPGVKSDPNGYTCDGERWWGSNYGSTTPDANDAVDILAPTILPTTDIGGSGGYNSGDYSMWFNGTSCATPFAAGVAALIKSQNPGWTPTQVRQQIVGTARDVINVESVAGWDRYSGYGMIDAGTALGGSSGNISPSANANGPYTGDEGVAIDFSSAGSFDNDGTIVSYYWDFGDGNSSTLANPSNVYASSGSYTVSLTVTDDDGAADTDNTTATITGICHDHELVLTLVLDNYPGETTWEIKDAGGNTLASGGPYSIAGATETETFCLPDGDYTFTIHDAYGDGICCTYGNGSYELAEGSTIYASGESFASSESTSFTLGSSSNTPPVADAGGPYTGTEGVAVSFDGSGSSDLDGDTLSYSWNFGDGGTGSGVSPNHTYAAAGSYTVTLTVNDGNGGTDNDTSTADISAAAGGWTVLTYDDFESGWGNYSSGGADCMLYNRGTYAHQGGSAADIQDNSSTASSFYYTNGIDVNTPGYTEIKVEFYFYAVSMDNSNENFLVQYYDGATWHTVADYAEGTDFNNNQFYFKTVTISESEYTFPANMKIRFLCDASGNRDDVYIDEITVSATGGTPPPPNTPPVADAGGPYTGTEGVAMSFDGSGSSDLDGDTLSYSWNFGDGGTGSGVSPNHTYAAAGSYTVTLTVDDGNGGTDNDTSTADIAAAGGWTVLTYDNFESGWGNYSNGGVDCMLYNGGTYAHQGNSAVDIQDNSRRASSFRLTNTIDLDTPGYTEIKIEFYFYAVSMDNSNENFLIQYYDGSAWHTIANYSEGTDFNNDQFYFKTVTISESEYTFPTNMMIRFRCDASADDDDVYIDEITISAQ